MCISKQENPPTREYVFCNTVLNYVDKHSYLGVNQDTNLRWQYHLQEISSKATKTLNLIERNFWFCGQDTKNTLYKALVRSKMEYASVVWDPYHQCDIDKLENIQRVREQLLGSVKMITGIPPVSQQWLKIWRWDSLASRRKPSSAVHHV